MSSKILVVDDEPSVCKVLRRFLEGKGYSVVEAHDGDGALAVYRQESPDVVLLDIRMPGKDGLETLRELRAFDPEASVIMVTAVHEEELVKQTTAEGAFDYITKPIDPEYLEAALMTKLALLGGIDNFDRGGLEPLGRESLQREIHSALSKLVHTENIPLNQIKGEMLIGEVLNEVLGLGPLETLLKDPTITDILVNNYDSVYIERGGKLEKTDVRFKDDEHLLHIIHRIAAAVGRRIDEASPMVDARLPDGSRVNAVIPPLALEGPSLSIRRFGDKPLEFEELIRFESLLPEMVEFLAACVKAKVNILISGGTGSGKTTLLNALSGFIPPGERIITIEDSAELQLQQPHVVKLETRPPDLEGKGEITQRDLMRNSLRMRPDRIIIGEVRSDEAIDMLQAMNTGHEGSLTTIHANSPRDALARLETMVAMAGLDMPEKAIRQQIASALHIIIQTNRFSDGKRKVTHITELTGMEGNVFTLQDLFTFDQLGVGSDGTVSGVFRATGIWPHFMERMETFGVQVPESVFNAYKEVPNMV